MNPKDPTGTQRQPGQSNEVPAQQGGAPPWKQSQARDSEASRQQNQQNLDEIGSDEDTEVDPLVDDADDEDEKEAKRTDDR